MQYFKCDENVIISGEISGLYLHPTGELAQVVRRTPLPVLKQIRKQQ